METYIFNVQGYNANTLEPEYLGEHDNGWKVSGDIQEEYCIWVNEFEAIHPVYGKVWGDFEKEVYADSKEGYENFIKYFPPNSWDYWEI